MAPLYPHRNVKLWLAREAAFSSFDPIAAALEGLAEVTIQDRLPVGAELEEHHGIVVVSRTMLAAGLGPAEIAKMLAERPTAPTQVLWLTGRIDSTVPHPVAPTLWPVPMSTLANFVALLGK
jgi:hypothetical protein